MFNNKGFSLPILLKTLINSNCVEKSLSLNSPAPPDFLETRVRGE